MARKRKCTRLYTEETVCQIEDMIYSGCTATEVRVTLGMKESTLRNLMHENAIYVNEPKPYRLPKFSGWSFHADNLTLARHL